ncbi:MAG: hypothetical protein ACC660_04680 [Acidimicrobiales bacterium]
MTSAPMPPLAPLETRADEVVAGAFGRTLVMWGPRQRRVLPAAVTSAEHFETLGSLDGVYDSVVSVGQLGTAGNLPALLGGLCAHLAPHSIVHFCEPTIAADEPTSRPPHDVTSTLWANGFTVIECRRFRARRHVRIHEYCWGKARRTPRR